MRLDEQQRRSVLRLLSDADEHVLDLVEEALDGYEDPVPGLLQDALRVAESDASRRIRERLWSHVGHDAEEHLRRVVAQSEFDLERAALAFARLEYPELDPASYVAYFDELGRRLRGRGVNSRDAGHAIAALNRLMFVEENFRGTEEAYEDPDAGYLNRVVDNRCGLPISLCTVYMAVGRRIDLPLCGVGMPSHFLVRFQGPDGELFIDVFRRGRLLTRRDCAEFLANNGISYRAEYLAPTPPRAILRRMAMDLFMLYKRQGDAFRRARTGRVLEILRSGAVTGEKP